MSICLSRYHMHLDNSPRQHLTHTVRSHRQGRTARVPRDVKFIQFSIAFLRCFGFLCCFLIPNPLRPCGQPLVSCCTRCAQRILRQALVGHTLRADRSACDILSGKHILEAFYDVLTKFSDFLAIARPTPFTSQGRVTDQS